ncbi:hypothetical protein PM082_023961 [Marasmius tenuissimus]|nr:hypothetical protein PM082_023961 [Marasmius tenuissimus]
MACSGMLLYCGPNSTYAFLDRSEAQQGMCTYKFARTNASFSVTFHDVIAIEGGFE